MNHAPAIIFDLGKVLLDFDYGLAIARLLPQCDCLRDDLHRLINQSPLLLTYERGDLTSEEFFDRVRLTARYRGGMAEFKQAFAEIFSEIPPMVALQQRLRKAGLPTYLFSNTNPIAVEHIRRRFPFFSQFDGYVLSYEHRALKPEPALYQVVEKLASRAGPALVYLDDRPENVAAARQRGWQAILHESPERTRQALHQLGGGSPLSQIIGRAG